MVVRMMKWRPWPPLSTKKFEAKIVVKNIKGLEFLLSKDDLVEKPKDLQDFGRMAIELKWKGSKGNALSSLRRSLRKNFTKEEALREDGIVEWDEEFQCVCNFSAYRDGVFHPWEVSFTLLNGLRRLPSAKISIVGIATLNIADFISAAEESDIDIDIPLEIPKCSNAGNPLLCLCLRLSELRTAQESSDIMPRRCISLPTSPEILSVGKSDVSPLRAGLRKVKIFKGFSSRRAKKSAAEDGGSDGQNSVKSEDVEYSGPLDTDSPDDMVEGEIEEENGDSSFTNTFNYGTLAYANHAGGSFYSNSSSSENEDRVYYSHRSPDVGHLYGEGSPTSVLDQSSQKSSKLRILSWKKRKLSFRAPKTKEEPLLKRHYGEEGGDDIDFDRRQFSSSDESTSGKMTEDSIGNRSSFSEFGDDNFAVGSWEQKEIVSRDGHMKLQSQVFFASIDQRSERAAGESACTALVAVIADWFQSNRDEMPIKSQLDSLIREGSLEWRNLCENDTYRERFPDKHFDLETILEAKVRPLTVAPEKGFVGFFHPEEIGDKGFDFLHGAMSFDNIWDEISQSVAESPDSDDPLVYIVSWNDHFFVLKVERDAYYIIDTLGERLYEGCNQAYILKFDKDTTIEQLPNKRQQSNETLPRNKVEQNDTGEVAATKKTAANDASEELSIVCRGKECCREYIKSFLAAIPIRELQVDIKKGLMASLPLHHRLQIEFHYTKWSPSEVESSSEEAVTDISAVVPLEV